MRFDPVSGMAGALALGMLAWPHAAGAVAFLTPGLVTPDRAGVAVVRVEHRPLTIPEEVARFHKKHVRSVRRSIDKAVGHHGGRRFDSHHRHRARKGLYRSHGPVGVGPYGPPRRGLRHSGVGRRPGYGHGPVRHHRDRFDRRRDRFEHRLDYAERQRIEREIGYRRMRRGDVRRPLPNPNVYRYFTVKPRHRPMLSP